MTTIRHTGFTDADVNGRELSSQSNGLLRDDELVMDEGNRKNGAYKSADQSVASSTTLQADNHLLLANPALAGESFGFECLGFFDCSAAGGIKLALGVNGTSPSIDDIKAVIEIYDSSGNLTTSGVVDAADAAVGTAFSGAQTDGWFKIHGSVKVGSGSSSITVGLYWAQQASDATNTTVKQGSYAVGRKIGY